MLQSCPSEISKQISNICEFSLLTVLRNALILLLQKVRYRDSVCTWLGSPSCVCSQPWNPGLRAPPLAPCSSNPSSRPSFTMTTLKNRQPFPFSKAWVSASPTVLKVPFRVEKLLVNSTLKQLWAGARGVKCRRAQRCMSWVRDPCPYSALSSLQDHLPFLKYWGLFRALLLPAMSYNTSVSIWALRPIWLIYDPACLYQLAPLLLVLCHLGCPELQSEASKVNYQVSVTENTHCWSMQMLFLPI